MKLLINESSVYGCTHGEKAMSDTMQVVLWRADELTAETLSKLIFERKSFDITHITDMGETVNKVEKIIEGKEHRLRCRVYTEYRSSAVAGALWSPTLALGALSAAAIGVHNLATWSPDYELGKNYLAHTLSVRYKK